MSDDGDSADDYEIGGYRSDESLESDSRNPFLELEAVESGNSSENDDSDSDDGSSSESDSQRSHSPFDGNIGYFEGPSSFPQFMQLPPELRHHIWRLFCPDLVAKSRVFDFRENGRASNLYIEPGEFVQQQTEPIRAVLATHRESRALASGIVPDILRFGPRRHPGRVIRFNKERDIVYWKSVITHDDEFILSIKHIAVDAECLSESGTAAAAAAGDAPPYRRTLFGRDFVQNYPNLETVYIHVEARDCKLAEMPWLQADKLNAYHFATYEEEPGLGEDLDFCYCWPDPAGDAEPIEEYRFPDGESRRNRGRRQLGSDDAGSSSDDGDSSSNDSDSSSDHDTSGDESDSSHNSGFSGGDVARRRVPVFPLVKFELESGMEMVDRLMEWRRTGGELDLDWDSSSESGSEPNEYESEGIDDEEIDEESQASDDDDDDLAVVGLSEDGSEGGGDLAKPISLSSSDVASDSDRSDGVVAQPSDHTEYPAAAFSSPEVGPGSQGSSATLQGRESSESSSSEEESPPVRMVQRPKRRIVSSDAEDDSDDEPVARPAKRARVVLSESDDDEEEDNDE
jgi:hypothetical protein